ncbi:chlorinating enzyme [Pseudoalteromonas luteoviolacea]|uniref:Chlorinating enzyme n=1 Tax=Pseudoalteromonas luteoviolacea NCIMB 1942 TaxID=1365253 RepID=A0A161XX07_9GAMM|nr:chlorinating enzyme [Pseudoalteromonas luteoviolacea]KZN47809.1 hypothetical protein N482_08840 [Pseudoalteromonas luteoviolacea NCIMB 1942]KZW99544.1 chlorinating protein [Pseudoalteromonas luteoviolacea]
MNSNDVKKTFEEQGFIGPFKLFEPEGMKQFWRKQRMDLMNEGKSARAVYNNPVNYDRHLDIEGLSGIISQEAIVEKLRAIIGDDILCWRTEFFPKNQGDSGTGWHQVETYSVGENTDGLLEATETKDGMPMELTVWVAMTDATKENGCMKFIRGSHKQWYYDEKKKLNFNKSLADTTFFGYDYSQAKLDDEWNPDNDDVVPVEMKAGEFIIFTARCVHGSYPNTSRKQRMGFSIRVVPPHVKVYGNVASFTALGHEFDTSKHSCVLVSGQNDYSHNKVATENQWGVPFKNL